jgi:hypothetical protein
VLYIFYNADLVEEMDEEPTNGFGYIDDINALACSRTAEENCRKLETAYAKASRWATTHASLWAPKKFGLVHFTPPSRHCTVYLLGLAGTESAWLQGEIQPTDTPPRLNTEGC